MEKNLLNTYVPGLLESCEQNLSAYTIDKNPECLHRLRVDIKKINAIFSFAKYIYKENYDAPELKPLFNKAGEIREMQINNHLLSSVPHPPERLITWLKKKENILMQQFIKNVTGYIMLIKDFREKAVLPEMLRSKKNIIKYFKKEKIKANKILRHKDREGMHRFRKKIKKIMYVYSALPKRMQNKIALNVAEINSQQKKLGDWHDTFSAINFFSSKHFPIQTSGYLLMLKEKENRQFKNLLIYLANERK